MPTTTWADARRRARRASKTPTQTSSNTPAQVEGAPLTAAARRLGDTCEGLVNPNMDGPCVDGFPNGWIRHGTNALGECVDGGDDEYYDLSNSRPAESIRQELPPGSVWGAGTTIEISQEELGLLAGVSRQVVNRALRALEEEGLLKAEHGRITVVDAGALSHYES